MVPEVFVELVEIYKDTMSIKSILELFDISKSSYYRWKNNFKNRNSTKSNNDSLVIDKCKETNYSYGYRIITGILNKEGHSISKNTVQRIMQKYDLQCRVKIKKQRKHKGKESFVAKNIIDRDFKATRPFKKLVTDITYLPWGEDRLYLSSIMDLYNGQIVAYTIGETQDLSLVMDTLNQLPNIKEECILHSDQGAVYTSRQYQTQVYRKSITMSMSHKGTPADNAPIESFHSILKSETFYRYPELKSSKEIISQTVINFIHHYNNIRIQAKLGFMSPIQYQQTQIPA